MAFVLRSPASRKKESSDIHQDGKNSGADGEDRPASDKTLDQPEGESSWIEALPDKHRSKVRPISHSSVTLGAIIGRGSFCDVYRCQVRLREEEEEENKEEEEEKEEEEGYVWKDAALKLWHAELTADCLTIFHNEMEILADLQGLEGIPVLYGKMDSEPFGLVMSYAGSRTLGEFQYRNPWTIGQMAELFASLLRILEGMQRRGYCHYDLHTGNVVLDEERRPTVIDFNLSGKCRSATCTDLMYFRLNIRAIAHKLSVKHVPAVPELTSLLHSCKVARCPNFKGLIEAVEALKTSLIADIWM